MSSQIIHSPIAYFKWTLGGTSILTIMKHIVRAMAVENTIILEEVLGPRDHSEGANQATEAKWIMEAKQITEDIIKEIRQAFNRRRKNLSSLT